MAAVTALALKPLGIKVHAEDGKVKNKGQFADSKNVPVRLCLRCAEPYHLALHSDYLSVFQGIKCLDVYYVTDIIIKISIGFASPQMFPV